MRLLRLLLLIFLATALAPVSAGRSVRASEPAAPRFGYPIAESSQLSGAGLIVRRGYAVEKTRYPPGDLHMGEDEPGNGAPLPVHGRWPGHVGRGLIRDGPA